MARGKNYTLGAGKLYFDRLDASGNSTGEFYIGNTPSLTYSTEEERLEHFSSDEASRDKDASIVIRADDTISFTTDDIQPENMAMMFKGTAEALVTAPASAETESITVRKGRWYQLGVDPVNSPTGLRLLDNTTVEIGGVAVPNVDNVNYELDETLGRIFVKEDAPGINDDDVLEFEYDVLGSSRTVIINEGDKVRGALRYIADNTEGPNNDHFWPLVEFSPDGEYEFKGDNWNEMSFSGEILSKTDSSGTRLRKHYVDGRAVAAS